ncbi:MAG: hypothetical protein LBD20_10495 [Spirochaetaceae bacterium]|jgi:hypothetical protein|nr:hypothetical protein [Spirochaetaceae bacterium]
MKKRRRITAQAAALALFMAGAPLWAQDAAAEAAGAKVTLTGKVELKKTLTVPAGVTLDIVAKTAQLALHDGAKLTVDGTVNASGNSLEVKVNDRGNYESTTSVGIGIYGGGGRTLINGSGTIRLQSKGALLFNVQDGHELTLDGVTLIGLKNNDSPLVKTGTGRLYMKSGVITGNTNTGDEYWSGGGGVVVSGSDFEMEGGTITGNSAARGGGVYIYEGQFNMSGNASVSGNIAKNEGGGVSVGGRFSMSGNASVSGNTSMADGGGVFIRAHGSSSL